MTHTQLFPRAVRPGIGLFLALTACGGDIEPSPVASAVAYLDPTLAPEARFDDLLQLPLGAGAGDPLFPFGFGLSVDP